MDLPGPEDFQKLTTMMTVQVYFYNRIQLSREIKFTEENFGAENFGESLVDSPMFYAANVSRYTSPCNSENKHITGVSLYTVIGIYSCLYYMHITLIYLYYIRIIAN